MMGEAHHSAIPGRVQRDPGISCNKTWMAGTLGAKTALRAFCPAMMSWSLINLMPTFTVHEPPPRKGKSAEPERFLFVRDGFYFWGFALAPLWLLFRRLWLVFVLYAILLVAVEGALTFFGVPGTAKIVAGLLIALLVGLEAGTLRRWTLEQRGWKTLGFVVGDDLDDAERRFFAEWAARAPAANEPPPSSPSDPQYTMPVRRGAPTGSDVIGLFPEPGGAP